METGVRHNSSFQRRVAALEEMLFRKHRARKAASRSRAPCGPPSRRWPPRLRPYAVSQMISSWEKKEVLARTVRGKGQCASVYVVIGQFPCTEIPYGSWSSTLYKLQQAGELAVHTANKNTSIKRKLYGRGARRVLPTGEEMREIAAAEKAWREFRAGLKVENPAEHAAIEEKAPA